MPAAAAIDDPPVAHALVETANVSAGQRALDVGCGPGALTAFLSVDVRNVAASLVSATSFILPQGVGATALA